MLAALLAGCAYEPAFDVTCTDEGARDGDRVCTDGVWVRATPEADMSAIPDAITADADIVIDTPADCVPELDAALCARLGLTCENVTANDNCGVTRTANCGVCTGQQSCGGGGTANVCACSAQSDIDFCAVNGAVCEPFTGVDACGDMRTVDCGTCGGLETCAADNTCTCDVAAACTALNANCGMVDVTGMCAGATSITCGSCGDANASCGAGNNRCGCNAGYAGNGLTCADVDECGANTDNCDANATCTNTPGSFTCACNAGYTGNGVTCAAVSLLVNAVETVEISMDDTSATGTLGGNVVVANSVPFMTVRLEDTDEQGNRLPVDVWLSADDEVMIERDNAAGVAIAQVSVVEFNPAHATVQSGTFSLGGPLTTSVNLTTAVNPAKSFVVFYFQRDNGSANRDDLFVAGDLNAGGTAVTFARLGNAGTIDGHFWVVEAVTTAFSVQHVTGSLTSIANNFTLSSVTTAKSFLLYSYSSDHQDNDSDRSQVSCGLTASTNVTCRRGSVTDAIPDLRIQAVSLAGAEFVQRGDAMVAASVEMMSVTLGAAVDRTSTAFGGHLGVAGVVLHNTASGGETPGGFFTQRLNAGGTGIELKRGTPRAATARVEWQVIDW